MEMDSQTPQPSSWFSFGRITNATNTTNAECTSVPASGASPRDEQDTCNDDATKHSCPEQSKRGMVLKGNSSISILSYCRQPQPKSTVIVLDIEEHEENDSDHNVHIPSEFTPPASSSIRQQRSNSLPSSLSPGKSLIDEYDFRNEGTEHTSRDLRASQMQQRRKSLSSLTGMLDQSALMMGQVHGDPLSTATTPTGLHLDKQKLPTTCHRASSSSARQRRRQSLSSLQIKKSIVSTEISNQDTSMAAAAAVVAAEYASDDEPSPVKKSPLPPSRRAVELSSRQRRRQSLSNLSSDKSTLLANRSKSDTYTCMAAAAAAAAQFLADDVPSNVEKPSTGSHRVPAISSTRQRRRQSLSSLSIDKSTLLTGEDDKDASTAPPAAPRYSVDDGASCARQRGQRKQSPIPPGDQVASFSTRQRRRQSFSQTLSSLSIDTIDKSAMVADAMDQAHPTATETIVEAATLKAPLAQAIPTNKQRRRQSLPTNVISKVGILWMECEDDEATSAVAPSAPSTTRGMGTGQAADNSQELEQPLLVHPTASTAQRTSTDNSVVGSNAKSARPSFNRRPSRRRSTGYKSSKSDANVTDDRPSQRTGELLEDWNTNIRTAVVSERLLMTRQQSSFEQAPSTKRSLMKSELVGSL